VLHSNLDRSFPWPARLWLEDIVPAPLMRELRVRCAGAADVALARQQLGGSTEESNSSLSLTAHSNSPSKALLPVPAIPASLALMFCSRVSRRNELAALQELSRLLTEMTTAAKTPVAVVTAVDEDKSKVLGAAALLSSGGGAAFDKHKGRGRGVALQVAGGGTASAATYLYARYCQEQRAAQLSALCRVNRMAQCT
jgi:hypothetical protein